MLALSHAIECEILRERVDQPERRLGEVEEERDTSERMAGGSCEFLSRRAWGFATRVIVGVRAA